MPTVRRVLIAAATGAGVYAAGSVLSSSRVVRGSSLAVLAASSFVGAISTVKTLQTASRVDALLPVVGGMKDRTDPLWTNNSFLQNKQTETTGGQLGYGHTAAPGTTYSHGCFNGMVNIISYLQDCHSNTDSACHSAIQRINQILGVLSQAGLMQSNGG